jgi:hypothetical protein
MAEETATEQSVLDNLNKQAGRKDYFEVREVETASGMVTQIISGGGSLVLQANGTGDEVWKKLAGQTTGVVDDGENPKDSVEDNKEYFTPEGSVAFPTQPEAIEDVAEPVEVNPAEEATVSPNQMVDTTPNQVSQPEPSHGPQNPPAPVESSGPTTTEAEAEKAKASNSK